MGKLESGKYIISESDPNRPELADIRTRILHLADDTIEGAFSVECVWFFKGCDEISVYPHKHDFDEVLAFIGSDPAHPHDLGGEVDLWLDGEKHVLTKSCVVYLPKGLIHCPLVIRKVNKPIFHFSTVPVGKYKLSQQKKWPVYTAG